MVPNNDAVPSQSLMDVTTATKRQQITTSTRTLASPSSLHEQMLPTLPFDLILEILCRLPVKPLLQLKCVCKFWNSLISDPKFAKKHLRMSTACHDHHHLVVASRNTSRELLLWDSPISSIFSKVSSTSIVPQLQLMWPDLSNRYGDGCFVSSCDGILLFDGDLRPPLLWNPSIRKFKILPPLLKPSTRREILPPSIGRVIYTFGYDHFIDNYKIFAVSFYKYERELFYGYVDFERNKSEVSVYILGTDSWRKIDDIPSGRPINGPGIFASGTVNWLAFDDFKSSSLVLVSLDLEKESYRKLLTPDLNNSSSTLGVLRDCLCIFTNSDEFLDVWVMKEYGIKESWTKLFSVPYEGGGPSSFAYTKVVYASEDDLVLLDCKEYFDSKLVVYNFKNGTFKIPKIQNISCWILPKVYVDSLISPCC